MSWKIPETIEEKKAARNAALMCGYVSARDIPGLVGAAAGGLLGWAAVVGAITAITYFYTGPECSIQPGSDISKIMLAPDQIKEAAKKLFPNDDKAQCSYILNYVNTQSDVEKFTVAIKQIEINAKTQFPKNAEARRNYVAEHVILALKK